ncbi:MAG: DUF669 domain-containing protein [Planctomycetota bacterium]|jgi:hypothetical protein|nr:DUF669 domain-containing protein [Planctomycetota bacterium]
MGADLRGCYEVDDAPSAGVETLPAGLYTVKISDGEWKDTKTGGGQYLQINMTVAEGDHEGAAVIDRLNLKNPSDQVRKIARGQFAALREAVGVRDPKDVSELADVRFQVMLKVKKYETSEGEERTSNRVQRYLKRGESPAAPRQSDEDPPWGRNAPRREPPPAAAWPARAGLAQPAQDDIPF